MSDWTPEDIQRLITNPFYCINIAPMLCEQHTPMISEEQWIAAAAKLIKDDGADVFLRNLLENLKGNYLVSDDDSALRN